MGIFYWVDGESNPRCFRGDLKAAAMRTCERARRGREHLVDWERSEPIYLVIRDQIFPSTQIQKTPGWEFFVIHSRAKGLGHR